jgi:putative AlgH/UPF0301 family transcriptional regulator
MPILVAMAGKHSSISGGELADDDAPKFGDSEPGSLTNHLLIAMPQLSDPNFAQTVAIICEHTDKGALGIVLNKPLPMKLSDVLSQMKLEPSTESIAAQPVLRGGPVHTDRGFVLHRPGGQWDHTHKVSETLQVTPRATYWPPWPAARDPPMRSSHSAMPAGSRASSSAK